MAKDSFVLLGWGRARATWFRNVSSWATSSAVPIEFSKCVSVSEVRQRLSSMKCHSALLVEAGLAGLDRDLLDLARRVNTPVFVVDPVSERNQQWLELGAAVVLPGEFTPTDLLYALNTHARVIARIDTNLREIIEEQTAALGRLIAVCGPGGTGASTVAISLAQGLAEDVTQSGLIVLADLARNGEQAMLHDAIDVVPGIEELVDLARTKTIPVEEVRNLTFDIAVRRYRLLLGPRRLTAWSNMPPRAINESLRVLQRAFRIVICDITADFEGESDGGSIDVEERNALSRTAALKADVVVAVGQSGFKGIHSLARLIRELVKHGVEPSRITPIVNQAPKTKVNQAEIVSALKQLVPAEWIAPVFVSDQAIDRALRDGARLPKQLVQPISHAVSDQLKTLSALSQNASGHSDGNAIEPGSLGFLDTAI